MKATNNFAPGKPNDKPTFSLAVTSESMQSMITRSLGSAQAAARFTSTLISAVSSSDALKECEASTIVAAALRGEGMGLIYGHGYYIVPYKPIATFSLGYKGYIQLAMSTGFYADMDAIEIREGERKGRDPRKGKPVIDMSVYDTDEEREKHPVIGYYAYYELKDGSFRYEYWTVEQLLKHADHYAPAFSLEKYTAMLDGKLNTAEVDKLRRGSSWYDVGGGQEKMFRKTVLRQLLNSGYAPLSNEVRTTFQSDVGDNSPIVPGDFVVPVDPDTGEVTDNLETDKTPFAPSEGFTEAMEEETPAEAAPEEQREKKAKRGSVKDLVETKEGQEQDSFADSFFGGGN